MGSLIFEVEVCRLEFEALESVSFGKHAGNTWRGAVGRLLHDDVFRPRQETGPSGFRDLPRPFVLRVSHLNQTVFSTGVRFAISVHVFARGRTEKIIEALAMAAANGLGPGRGHCRHLRTVTSTAEVRFDKQPLEVSELKVRFLTPTELKVNNGIVQRPEFGVLMARVRDRIATIGAMYGPGEPDIDFRAFGERASKVHLVGCEIRRVRMTRRSSRTLDVHQIGGMTGEARYRGDLAEFVPWLRAAEWTGVGRHAVWGNGQIAISDPQSDLSPT